MRPRPPWGQGWRKGEKMTIGAKVRGKNWYFTQKKDYFLDAIAIAPKPITDASSVTNGERGA
jgi:hypothetical protein